MLYAARWLGMLLVLGVHASAAFLNFNALTPETTPLFIAAWRFAVNYAAFDGHYDLRYILTNLLNLQGVIATHYGSNGPLWSVGYEFWYYMVFPLFLAPLIASLDQKRGIILAALATLFCLAISLRQIWFPFGLTLWALGAWVSVPKQPRVTSTRDAFGLFLFGTVLLGVIFNNDVYHATRGFSIFLIPGPPFSSPI